MNKINHHNPKATAKIPPWLLSFDDVFGQTSYGAGVSIPLGAGAFSVSGNYGNEKVKANTQTTNEVAGIYAGTGGFDINVKGNTHLDAAVIASETDQNHLRTGTLTVADKANHSDYNANSMNLSASYSGKQTENVIGKDGKPTGETQPKMVKDSNGNMVQAQSGIKGFNASLPSVLSAKDSADSTTRAGIAAGQIEITDAGAQQQLTGQSAEQTIAGLNRDTENNSTLANLYEQDKAAIQTGFAIGRSLGQNFNSFMAIMASDMDKAGKEAAVGKDGKPLIDVNGQPVLGKDGKPITVKEAYQDLNLRDQLGAVNVDGQKIDYGVRQNLWGSGGTGNILATAVVGAFSGNVTGGAGELLKNTAINVVRAYGATEIKAIADGFKNPDGSTNGTSETVRGLLHAIAGCAGASATGGDCATAAIASGGTVAMNNAMGALLNLDPSTMTEEQKQAYSNLMGTLVSGVTSAVGGDTAAAQLATKVEIENNDLRSMGAYDAPTFTWKDKVEIAAQIKKNQVKAIKDKIVNTKVQVEGAGNVGMGAHAHWSVKATVGINHGYTVDEAEAGVEPGVALRFKLGGTVVEGTPKNPSVESGVKPYVYEKTFVNRGNEARPDTISIGTKAAVEGDFLVLHGEALSSTGVDSKVGGKGDTSTYAGVKVEGRVQPQIGAGAAAYWDIFNWQYKNNKLEGN